MKNIHKNKYILAIMFVFTLLISGASWAVRASAFPNSAQTLPDEAAQLLGSGFSYQGYLVALDGPANGNYDFSFELFDAETEGVSLGTLMLDNVPVDDGLFNVSLDFGSGVFDGEERWLEISVRPGAESDGYTPLTDRQRVSPAPYALYAVEAGKVAWLDVAERPAGLDDGDDDTTYTAGHGLDLVATTFNIMTSTIQTRVMGSCEPGSYVRAINVDGSVVCQEDAPLNRGVAPAANAVSAPDTDETGGTHTSITIGTDGLPIISHYDEANDYLKVAHCNDLACTSAGITALDTDGQVGWHNSIVIGSDGLPIISYHDLTNSDLKVAHCDDTACTSATITTVDDVDETGKHTSIAIGTDGLPIISYYDISNGYLKVAHCDNVSCTSASIVTVDTAADVGRETAIAIGSDGLPVISYRDVSTQDLKVAHCNDTTCTSATITTLTSVGSVGWQSAITIGDDGLPIISCYSDINHLIVAHCNNIACTNATISAPSSGSDPGRRSSITIGADGFPIISHWDISTGDLIFTRCHDAACTSATNTLLGTAGDSTTSITIGVDGLPVISYQDTGSGVLKVLHCSNQFCVPYWQRR